MWLSGLPESVKIIMGVWVILIFTLGYMARRRTRIARRRRREWLLTQPREVRAAFEATDHHEPNIGWLGNFRMPELPPERVQRMQRTSTILAGAKLIMLGVALPVGYVVLTAMMFGEFEAALTALIGFLSLLCITLGIIAIVRSRKP
jgi:hypothetical protein